MNSIKIFERPEEARTSYNFWDNNTYTPVYMERLGAVHFLWSIPSHEESYRTKERKHREEQLKANGGTWFKFYGGSINCGTPNCKRLDPVQWARWVSDRGYHYQPTCLDKNGCNLHKPDGATFFDFSGNLKEISSAFHYRIYDLEIVRQLNAIINGVIIITA